MPIQQNKQQSDLEKRLQILRRQVYGKEKTDYQINKQSIKKTDHSAGKQISYTNTSIAETDTKYLHQDLLKILLLSSLAIGLQITLFILSQNHLINLSLF